MSSTVSYVKSGTIIQCSTSSLPRPRPQTAWPIPVFPSTGNSFLALAIQGVKNNSAQAVVVTTPVALPGSASAVWTLYWTAYQGSAPPVLSWHSVSVPSSGLGTGLMLLPPNDATVVAYLQRGEAGQTSTYAQVSISTPPLALTDVGYLAPSEQLAVVLQWNQTQALKTTLDAAASALSVSSASYDASIATLSSNLIAATAPANWATAWPSTDIFASAGIKTNLATWWAAIASQQTALQSALANAAAIATGAGAPTAIGDGVTTTYIYGGGTVKINGVTTAAYTTYSGLLTFTAAPSMGALLQGVSTNAQQGVTQINSLDYLTNIDKIILMQDWNSEASIQTALDTQATTLSITTEKTNYDSAVTALSTSIISAGAPANWATIWPDGTIWNHSGIMTSLKSWWASIASTRTLLMNKISNTVLTLGGSTATWGSISGAAAQASPAGGWTGSSVFTQSIAAYSAQFNITDPATGGVFTSAPVINLRNASATNNNIATIGIYDQSGAIVAHFGGVITDHANHSGALSFGTRLAGAYAERFRINPAGDSTFGANAVAMGALTATTGSFSGTLTANGIGIFQPTVAAGAYGLKTVGASGAARDIFIAGQSGYSNGFTVQFDGAKMLYGLGDPTGITTISGSVSMGALTATGGAAMTAGWNRTVTLQDNFPGLIFNSQNNKWASINYDYSSNMVFRVGATTSDVFASGVNALALNASTGAATFASSVSMGALTATSAQINGNIGVAAGCRIDGASYIAINPSAGERVLLNWNVGTATVFGNGAGAEVGRVSNAGLLTMATGSFSGSVSMGALTATSGAISGGRGGSSGLIRMAGGASELFQIGPNAAGVSYLASMQVGMGACSTGLGSYIDSTYLGALNFYTGVANTLTLGLSSTGAATFASSVSMGALTATTGSFSGNVSIYSAPDSQGVNLGTSGGVLRNKIYISGAETGSNVGSDFSISQWSDAGAYLRTALILNRATGAATFASSVSATSFTDGYTTFTFAQINRAGAAIELQYAGGAGSLVRVGGSGSNPITLNANTGAVSMGALTATTGTFSGLLTMNAGASIAANYGIAIADGAPGTTTGKLYSVSAPAANTLMWNGSKVMTIGTVGQDQATLQAALGMAVAPLVGTIAQRTAYSVPTGTLPYWYATDETAPDGQLGTLRLWSGSAWGSAATPSTVVGRVIAGTIAAGAVSTQALAANVVTAAKLNVSDINSAGTLTVTGAQITINGSTTFTGGMSTTGLVGAINGGSTNINGSRVVITGASGIVGAINTANGGSNTTTIDGGSITALSITTGLLAANSITTGLLAANSITAAKLESTLVISNLIESSDYTESSGVPTAGFKMDSAEATYKFKAGAGWLGTALKIGSGTYTLNDIGVRAIAGIDATGLTSTDVIWWRGNNDTTNNAGAPIILDPMYSRDQYYNVGDRVIAGTASTPAYNTGKAVYECTTAGLSIRMGQGTAAPAAWNSGTAYNAGMPVSFSGNIFLSLKASTNVTPVVTANWSSGTTYAAGDQCYANSAIYYSLQGSNTNHTPPSPSAVQDSWWAVGYNPNGYWIDGGALVYQGAYSGATTYTTGQTCLSNSRVFKSISGSTGQAPPTSGNNTYWTDLGNMYCPQGTLRATDSYVDGAAKWKCVGWMWGDVSSPGIHAWVRNTTYAVGDLVCSDNTYGGSQGYTGIINSIYGNPLGAAAISGLAYCGSRIYRCVTAGTTSAINYGPSGTGTGITDNAAVWDYWSENTGPEDRLQIWGISVDTPGSGFQWEARIQPKTNRDNLDALTHLEVEIRGTDGVWYGHDVVPYQTNVALPSRKYYSTNPVNHILNMTRTMFEFKAPGINNGYLFPQGSPYGVSGKLRVRLHNVYGASDAIDLVAWNAVNTVPTPYANNMSVVVQKGGGSQGWHHCPEGWVKVTTMRGDIRADEVVPGDKVPTFHESTGEFGVYRVSAVERSQSETVMLELRKTFSDETSVICELAFALNHKVLRNGIWESLSNIPNGTILQSTDGTKLEVLSISSRGMNDVVQIMVDDAHTYSTESLLSHNLKIM